PASSLFPYSTLFRSGVRAVGARRAREPRERDRELDARGRENDLARSPHDGVGPLERRPVGELDRDDEVALVLRRNEARRDGPEPDRKSTRLNSSHEW